MLQKYLCSSSCNPSLMQKNLISIKIAFSGQHWTGPSIEKCEKNSRVTKRSISGMNQSKNQQFMTFSSLQFILFKMSINNPPKWKISTKIVFFQQAQFSWFGAHFVCRPKIMTYGQVFQKIIFGSRLPYKKKLKS